MKRWKRVTISIIGGILVTSLILVVMEIYPERMDSTMLRYVWTPGVFVAAIVFRGGVHDGLGFICLDSVFTIAFYALVIYALVGLPDLLEKNRTNQQF